MWSLRYFGAGGRTRYAIRTCRRVDDNIQIVTRDMLNSDGHGRSLLYVCITCTAVNTAGE